MDSNSISDTRFLLAIIDHVAHPIFVKDRAFRFVLVNQALCNMVGYPRDEMLGKTDYDFFPKEQSDFFRVKDIEMFSKKTSVHIEEEPITDKDGALHVLSTTKVPLRSKDTGEVTHLVGIIADITLIKAAEKALKESNDELERRVTERTKALAEAQAELVRKERLALLGQLAGGVAHQIRNPLGAIINACSLLQRIVGHGNATDASRAVEIISEEVWRANRIITDLLDYARIRPVTLTAIRLEDVIQLILQSNTVDSKISVVVELKNLPPILADQEQVRNALDNLIKNSIEAMPQGGQLTITARIVESGIVLSIIDTGNGMELHTRDHLFEPLFTTKPYGLGLGLPTAKALIENQGGSIQFVHPDTGGTQVDIFLPTFQDSGSDI